MQICFIADANSVHIRRWIAPLLEQGHRIRLLSTRQVQSPMTGVDDLVDLSKITTWRIVWLPAWNLWVRNYLRRWKPDILHAHWILDAGWLGMLSGYHPFIVTAWGSDILLERKKALLRRYLLKRVLKACDHLTVPSQIMYDAALVLGISESRLHLIPWGIETEVFRPSPDDRRQTRRELGLSDNQPVVLCSRAVTTLYNHETLLSAIRVILPAHPELRLVLVRYNADPEYLGQMEQRAKALGLEGNVLWLLPQATANEMGRLYRMADVVVSIPSSEGYGFTVYEALACGIPTIISDLPVFDHELAHEVHTLKVPVGDATRTAQALSRLLTNHGLCQTLRANGLQACQDKGIDVRVAQVNRLYAEAVAQSARKHENPKS